jgi:hypothetical protein
VASPERGWTYKACILGLTTRKLKVCTHLSRGS